MENKYGGKYFLKLTQEFWPKPRKKKKEPNPTHPNKKPRENVSFKTAPEIKGLHPSGNLKV